MGIKAKQRLLDILSADSGLKKSVKNISGAWHDSKKGYPQVTVTQLSNRPASVSDDKVDFRTPLLQVDIWDKGNPFLIADKIIAALEKEGYEPADEREQNEAEINRVILEYRMEE